MTDSGQPTFSQEKRTAACVHQNPCFLQGFLSQSNQILAWHPSDVVASWCPDWKKSARPSFHQLGPLITPSFLATSVLNACGAIDKRLGRQCTTDLVQPPPSFLPSKPTPLPYSSLTSHMSDQSGPSYVQNLFEAAFRDYERQTGKILANHSLAEKFQSCHTVESVAAVLREQTESSSEIRGKDKVFKPLKNVLSSLHKLSSASALNFGQHLGLVRP